MTTASQTSTASQRLRAKLGPLQAEMSARGQLMAEHPAAKEVYLALVRMLYSIVRASVPIMVAAKAAAEERPPSDEIAVGLVGYLAAHIEEERHHDEWLLEDWVSLGGDREALEAWPGSPTIAQAVGSAYYWTLHAHPVALLGYCVVLEGRPPSQRFIERLATETEYPDRAFFTLRHHSDVDDDHSAELYDLMDRLPLTPWHESLIGMTALQTVDLLIAAGDELLSSLPPFA